MKKRVLLSCALAAVLLAGCIARLPDADTLPPNSGDTSAAEPETIAIPETSPSTAADPYDMYYSDILESISIQVDETRYRQPQVTPNTGYPNAPIHEARPDFFQLPVYIDWNGGTYKRLSLYITDEDCEELDPKGSYTWWSDRTTSHENPIRLYSVGDIPASACVGTNFDIFLSGSLAVYVNESEWTEEMENSLSARAVQTS